MGTHLNARPLEQLCNGNRTVYVTFDSDANGSGQHAADTLAQQLVACGVTVRQVLLPGGHDPNSFFVEGGDARQFQLLLEAARP
jgi:DNA primase